LLNVTVPFVAVPFTSTTQLSGRIFPLNVTVPVSTAKADVATVAIATDKQRDDNFFAHNVFLTYVHKNQ
jgi:hypothetical protein